MLTLRLSRQHFLRQATSSDETGDKASPACLIFEPCLPGRCNFRQSTTPTNRVAIIAVFSQFLDAVCRSLSVYSRYDLLTDDWRQTGLPTILPRPLSIMLRGADAA
jgi:hypothetical protein